MFKRIDCLTERGGGKKERGGNTAVNEGREGKKGAGRFQVVKGGGKLPKYL